MITYVPRKNINYKRVEELLNISSKINHFTNFGPVSKLLERKLEELLNIDTNKRVICFSSGTAALHVVKSLVDNSSWAVPDFNFPSVAVGCGNYSDVDIYDIDRNTYTIPLDTKNLHNSDGIILTNLFGSYVNIDEWRKFCTKNGQTLIFDNASSPLSEYDGTNICNLGDYAIGSLHHTKYLGFGEGGFAVIPEGEYKYAQAISNFGFDDSRQFKANSSNFKMSDISAAFILQHIEQYDIKRHCEVQEQILSNIKNISNIEILGYKYGVVYGCLPIIFPKEIDHTYFKTLNVDAQKYYKPLTDCYNSTDLYSRIVNFPLNAYMTEKDINTIVHAIEIGAEL